MRDSVDIISPLITSVSSCTSSMVGHGSAICARGIFAGFAVSPSAAAQVRIWSPRDFSFSSFFVGAAPVKPSSPRSSFLGSKVQVEWISQHSALRSEAREDAASATKSFTNNCNPLLWLRRRLATWVYWWKVIIRLKTPYTPNKPLVLPGTRVGYSGFGFDKREREESKTNSVIL